MILLLGGTSESLEVADYLSQVKLKFMVSVISDYGAELAQQHADQVIKTVFTPESLAEFCQTNQVSLILDATHPFARVISQEAMNCAAQLGIKYLRFERPSLFENVKNLVPVTSMNEAITYLKSIEGTIYLSTGSKTAPDYATALGVERLHVRVLPTTRVLEKLTKAGFIASQIDAIQGPFSKELNIEMFKHAQAQAVVTKESGRQGGIQEKITACQALDIPCVIIRRPAMDYPAVVKDVSELKQTLEVNHDR
ncbi:precorrin-6A reductase [Lactobacillus sp. 3B(2020)]|uniref:precorrin-6A reductase n=1 Tax=Lactobacillus sp. 3B(2020) TaxID=2695882 RepID=UPI0015DF3840|nr:precorrin-6A reductase [Lactobacillus sp. 3B(2020)]QLL69176.1 precorrin-6A reductase [Lactobacillus sp. 3B(2020)]